MTPRIEHWSLYGLELPYGKPMVWASGPESAAPLLILHLTASDGSQGVAEVTVKPTWYGTSYGSLVAALEEIFLPMLLKLGVQAPSTFYEAAQQVPEHLGAKALIDNALWDLQADRTGVPLWKLLGGQPRSDVSWIVTRQPPDRMIAEALDAVERYGIKVFKLKGGQGFETDLKTVSTLRSALGEGVGLWVDANWHYQAAEVRDYLSLLAPCKLLAMEDPCTLAPDRAFERMQAESDLPILVDYFACSLRDAKLYAERGAKAISLKPARVGITECVLQDTFAREQGIRVHVGFGGESEVGACAALQLASSLWCRDTWLPAEVTFFKNMQGQLLKEPLEIVDGAISVPEAVSTAAALDFERLRAMATLHRSGRAGPA